MEDLGRMLGLKKLGVIAAVLTMLLAGCSDGKDEKLEATQALPDKPVTIEPLAELADASEYSANGVTIQVPNSLELMNEKLGGEELGDVTQVSFALPGADRASIILTIEHMPGADIKNAEFSALAMENTFNINGIGSEIEKSVLNWPEDGTGAALRANLQVELNGTETERETFTTIIAHETQLISVSVETAVGELDGSEAMQALRTLRIEG